MIKKLVVASVLSSAAMLAQADTYIGLQHVALQYTDEDLKDTNFRPNIVMLKIGHELGDNFAIEARIGTGLNDDTQVVPYAAIAEELSFGQVIAAAQPAGFEPHTASVTATYGLFAKFYTSFGDGVVAKPYFSLGYGATEIELKNSSREIDDPNSNDPDDKVKTPIVDSGLDETGVQLALGVDLQLTEMTALNIEYLSLYQGDDNDDVNGLSIGFNLRF